MPPAAVLWGEGFELGREAVASGGARGRRPLRFALVAALLRAEKRPAVRREMSEVTVAALRVGRCAFAGGEKP